MPIVATSFRDLVHLPPFAMFLIAGIGFILMYLFLNNR